MAEAIDSPKDEAPNDSLTLSQLKRIVRQFPNKQKPKEIAFSYADSDSLSNEINEFYSYAEITQFLENKKTFEEGFDESWINSTISERKVYVEYLLETLELKDPVEVHRGDESFGTELASLGGLDEIRKLRGAVREHNELSPIEDKELFLKSTPMDYHTFQTEVTHKYPTYVPPPCPAIVMPTVSINPFSNNNYNSNGNESSGQNSSNGNNNPSTPKSRKQQFQTNQRQPFIFPFSEFTPSVPQSIQEAGDLYLKYIYISLGTLQFWKEREEMKRSQINCNINGTTYKENFYITDATKEIKIDDNRNKDKMTIVEREKLERVEALYRSILPHLPNIVIVLLKLLLATVPSHPNNVKGNENDIPIKDGTSTNNGYVSDSHTNSSASSVDTIEEVDIRRHREITSKAVSAILLLMLKHLKLNHVLKFEYLSQLLVDANCLLLIFKILSMQDVSIVIKAKNEVDDLNFFRYCMTINNRDADEEDSSLDNRENCSKNTLLQQENESTKEKQRTVSKNDLNIDLDYCWRNLFASINFLRILQKLIKKKTHRILSLVRCKSSAILKKTLKVSHPLLELYALKVLKNQIPFIGRKWKQSNMKVITSIYMNCRPGLRDEWIASTDADAEVEDAVAKQSLREMIKFYNERNYFSQYNDQLNFIDNRNMPDTFPPHYTKPFDSLHSAYVTDDIMLDRSFIENWEQWLQEEVYGFSATTPQLNTIDEYYSDELATVFENGDGSGWDVMPDPLEEQDPFTAIDWNNVSSSELERKIKLNEYQTPRVSEGTKGLFNTNKEDPDLNNIDVNYCWPDELLDRIAPDEVMIYQPTPYQSDDDG
ncbi:11339_t:CDS:10 [Acaulospora colombiana]|uniref:11339_t:CDS:1 n=1 Tax=Acaulospora colombiana TaxID=27376 RepID=A0ACA9L2N4_9GLOM|nr:11339_t:CDS:10 [Acaulospora colombiana]